MMFTKYQLRIIAMALKGFIDRPGLMGPETLAHAAKMLREIEATLYKG